MCVITAAAILIILDFSSMFSLWNVATKTTKRFGLLLRPYRDRNKKREISASFVQTTSSMERIIEEFIPALWREISYKDVNQIVASPQSIGGSDRFRKIKYDIG